MRNLIPSRRINLFVKLMGAFILIVLIVAILINFLAQRGTRNQFNLYVTSAGQQRARILAPLLGTYYENKGSWVDVDKILRESNHGAAPPHNTRGGQRPDSPFLRGNLLLANNERQIISTQDKRLVGAILSPEEIMVGEPIFANGEQVGTILIASPDLNTLQNDAFLIQINRAIFLAVIIASVVALVLGGLVSWGVTRPLRQLKTAVEAITAGNLTQQVNIQPGDEIGDLAAAFNQMSSQLAQAEHLRRQMTADIAHELRTPLTVINGNVEALQDGIFPLTKEALDPIRSKTALLTRLVEDLRQLALAEANQLTLNCTATNLNQLIQHTTTAFQATAESQSIILTATNQPNLPALNIDPQRIEQILGNLLSNGLRHTPPNGTIRVTSQQTSQYIKVLVTDSGPGIPTQHLANIFERFYRVDKGRNSYSGGGGTGLGLAVARSIIEAHGGEIGVTSPPGAGATFWFSLPIHPELSTISANH